MKTLQFEDKGLAHYSYIALSEQDRKAVVIDPARDVQQYLDALEPYGAELAAIIETHPHADFVSGHKELSDRTGAPILVGSKVGVSYAYRAFDEGDTLELADFTLRCIETPGHSPDSISILLVEGQKPKALFSGDTLFVGDVGRPDLREGAGATKATRQDLARMMYQTIQQKLMPLPDDVAVYPAHGAGSLCGKALSDAASTSIGQERVSNPNFQPMTEEAFIGNLLADQPFVPKYFPASVEINRAGAPDLEQALAAIPALASENDVPANMLVIDSRPGQAFKQSHLPGAINLQKGGKFDTWLGSIVNPGEPFVLVAESAQTARQLLSRIAAIGYETSLKGYLVSQGGGTSALPEADLEDFQQNPERYTIVDVRNASEHAAGLIFLQALPIPLPELRERASEVPTDKPIMVHCVAGYRSAAGQSILAAALPAGAMVYDMGEAIKSFQPVHA